MSHVEVADKGVIFRNPLPGHRAINAFHPDICVMDDGELLCVLRIGSAMYSPDGVLETFRSQDCGTTWRRHGLVRDPVHDPIRYNYVSGCITGLRDGTLVMKAMRADQTDPNRLADNPETQGLLTIGTCYMRSEDRGLTWTDPSWQTSQLKPRPVGLHHTVRVVPAENPVLIG